MFAYLVITKFSLNRMAWLPQSLRGESLSMDSQCFVDSAPIIVQTFLHFYSLLYGIPTTIIYGVLVYCIRKQSNYYSVLYADLITISSICVSKRDPTISRMLHVGGYSSYLVRWLHLNRGVRFGFHLLEHILLSLFTLFSIVFKSPILWAVVPFVSTKRVP